MMNAKGNSRATIADRLAAALLDEWTPGYSVALRAGVTSTHYGHEIEPALELLVRDGRAERSTRRSTVVNGTERVYRRMPAGTVRCSGCGSAMPAEYVYRQCDECEDALLAAELRSNVQ